jgi:two-component system, NarL family, sensor histidine kinase DesK
MSYTLFSPSEPSRWRRFVGVGWVGIWLAFLGSPIEHVWNTNGGVGRAVGVLAVVAFGAVYLALFMTMRMSWNLENRDCVPPHRRIFALLGALCLLVLVALPFAQQSSLTMLVYLGAAAMFSFQTNIGVAVVAVLALLAEGSTRLVSGWQDQQWSASLAILFAGAAVYATRLAARRNLDLIAAREEMARMAVEEERSRLTRDLHDVLGHSLTVITVKAELASRLLGHDEARATAEIAHIERLAREALTDVRSTIAGRPAVTLAPELVNARAALASANIEAEVPGALDDVPAANRELFGWTVREGVTNVLRHSKASRCAIRLSGTSVEIHDDGIGALPVDADGNGLRGLRERVVAARAGMLIGVSPDLGGFLLQVSTPQEPTQDG